MNSWSKSSNKTISLVNVIFKSIPIDLHSIKDVHVLNSDHERS